MRAQFTHPASQRTELRPHPAGDTFRMERAEHARMRHAKGWTVRAMSGTVWLTQDGDPRDVVLEAGESFVVDRPGAVLLMALGAATVRLSCEPACRGKAPQRGLRGAFLPPAAPTSVSFA